MFCTKTNRRKEKKEKEEKLAKKQAKDLVSFLCGPAAQERPLGYNSLLTAEGDLEQRGSADGLSIVPAQGAKDVPKPCTTPPEAADNLEEVATPDGSLHIAEGDLVQRVCTAGSRPQRRCQPYARLMGGGALAPPSPVGAVATVGPSNPSDPVACHKHQGTKGWPISEACEACIALAYLHGNNHGEAEYSPLLIKKEPDGHHLSSVASGSTCVARPGSPDLAQDGPPPPPSFLACARHRKGRGGWSISEPCEACLDLAMQADLTEEAVT